MTGDAETGAQMATLRRRLVAAGLATAMDEACALPADVAEATGVSRHAIEILLHTEGAEPETAISDNDLDRLVEWAEMPGGMIIGGGA